MMSMKSGRTIREPLKKPRPLKSVSSTDQIKLHVSDPKETVVQKSRTEIVEDLETLNVGISNCNFDEVTAMDISRMCAILKKRGEELDTFNKDAMDRYFSTLRNACREERLDTLSRVKLLEVIELRARGWKRNENINNYFNQKIVELEHKGLDQYNIGLTSPTMPYPIQNQNVSVPSTVPLSTGEVLRSSGKFEKPTKISGKNFFKDEIIIRNSDSGKVMGIKGRRVHMIEELSDTVISFQRVNPGARDRLVQITGPHEEAIGHAKLLVEDTIRRNASPVRENADSSVFDNQEQANFNHNFPEVDNQAYMKRNLQHSYSLSDASLREYSFPLQIGQDLLTLSGTNAELLKAALSVLKKYLLGESDIMEKQGDHFSYNRQASPDTSMHRFDLRKQTSIKQNMTNNFQAPWIGHSAQRDSLSPFSSSDDDFSKEEKRSLSEHTAIHDLSGHNFIGNSFDPKQKNAMSLDLSSVPLEKFTRSSSISNEKITFPDIDPLQTDEVFSPLLSPDPAATPIPPPSYKRNTYGREFLLNCAKSPFSHTQPNDFEELYQNYREFFHRSPIMFDPERYEESRNEESTVCVLK